MVPALMYPTPALRVKSENITESTEKPPLECSLAPMCFDTAPKSLHTSTVPPRIHALTPKLPIYTPENKKALKTPPMPSDCEAFRGLVEKHFPADQVDIALAIFKGESSCQSNAVGDGHLAYFQNGIEYGKSYGVAQIRYLPGRLPPSELLKPEVNIQVAGRMFNNRGWCPWTIAKKMGYCKN